MKTTTLRCNDYLANWINGSCQKLQITISEFVRDLLYKKKSQGPINYPELKNKQVDQQMINPNKKELGYIVFTAKLLEKFVLATDKEGALISNQAFEETKELLEELDLNGGKNKQQQFCISLDLDLHSWIYYEASKLNIKSSSLIRSILESFMPEENKAHLLPYPIRVGVKKQVYTCSLLETFISRTANGAEIIYQAKNKAAELLQQ